MQIYARARQTMADSGNPTQWGRNFPPQELIEEDIDTNRLFVYLHNGALEGAFAFILGPDPTYAKIEDGQWLNDTCLTAPFTAWPRRASAPVWHRTSSTGAWSTARVCGADTHADNKIMRTFWRRTAS